VCVVEQCVFIKTDMHCPGELRQLSSTCFVWRQAAGVSCMLLAPIAIQPGTDHMLQCISPRRLATAYAANVPRPLLLLSSPAHCCVGLAVLTSLSNSNYPLRQFIVLWDPTSKGARKGVLFSYRHNPIRNLLFMMRWNLNDRTKLECPGKRCGMTLQIYEVTKIYSQPY